MSEPLLEVADLRVAFGSEAGRVDAVSGLGFTVGRGRPLRSSVNRGRANLRRRWRSWACCPSRRSSRVRRG